jgi:hypothetical protein
MPSHARCFPAFLLLLIGVLVSVPAAVSAQSNATIMGTVADTSGAAVPGATILVTNTETGAMQTRVSDAQGRYSVANLAIGSYDVQSEIAGFQTVLHKSIVLTVGRETVVDFALPVGTLSETLTVIGQAVQVDTTSSAMSNLVDQTQIRDLPLNGRNFEQLITLAPGVLTFSNVTKGAFYGAADAFTVSGSRPNGQQILLDNTNVMTFENRGSGAGILGTSMGVDAIAEFQTLTNTYGAQYGGNGGVVNSISKSGTNAWHGSVFEFARNSRFDARGFFETRVNPGETTAKPAPFSRNQFGGTIGGPIQRNKVFFFVNYEGLQQKLGETNTYTVLNALGRQGYLPTAAAGAKGPAGTYTCFGNPAGNTPTEGSCAIAPAIRPILDFYNRNVELPQSEVLTAAGLPTGTGNVVYNGTQPGKENYVLGRVDVNLSQKDSFYFRYLYDFADLTTPFAGSYDLYPAEQQSHNQFFTVEEKRIYTNNLLGTTRFAYMRPLNQLLSHTKYPEMEFYPGAGLPDGRFTQVTGLNGGGAVLGPIRQNPLRLMYDRFHVGEDFIWSQGAHSVRFGGAVTRQHPSAIQNSPAAGEWTFTSIPLFLQGMADRYFGLQQQTQLTNGETIAGTDGQRDWIEYQYTLYVQEDWRVRENFTVNLGVRYAPTSNPTEINGKMTHIIPVPAFLGSVPCTIGTANCSAIGTVLTNAFTPVDRVYDRNASLKNIAPRIGFAWDPTGDYKTSIRGGWGIFHSIIEARDYEPGYALTPPYSLVTVRGANAAGASIGNALPFSQRPAAASAPGIAVSQSQQLGWNRYNTKTPYMMQWNVSLQREVAQSTVATLAYVGSAGRNNYGARNANPPVAIANPDYNFGLQFGTGTGTTLVENPLVNPNFGPMILAENISFSNYKSFQVGLVRRLNRGWQSQLSYTWSKCEDTGSGSWGLDRGTNFQNPYDPDGDLGRCAFDMRHNLVINGMYQLPFTGNPFVEGWQVSGIVNYRSGLPTNVTDGIIRAFDNQGASNRPNYVPGAPGCNGNPILPESERFPAAGNPRWINTACFQLPRLGELGNTPRNFVDGPNYVNVDAALIKNINGLGPWSVQLRAEVFNLLNRTNFNVPSAGIFAGNGTVNPTAGTLTSIVGTARQFQFGMKIQF